MSADKQPADRETLDSAKEFEQVLKSGGAAGHYVLRLYVTGTTPRSAQAVASIRSLCEEYLPGRYDLEVIDLYQQPAAAAGEQIVAAPTLIKKLPMPVRRMVGNLSDRDRVLIGLDLRPPEPTAKTPETRWVSV